MRTLNDLFDLVKQSDVTLIGYTFQDEKIKDELISNYNYIDVGQIDSSFSLRSFLRDLKLNSILKNDNYQSPEYLLVDIDNIFYDSGNIGNRRESIRMVTEKLRSEIYSEYSDYYPQNPFVKIIITQPMNTRYPGAPTFTGGNSPLYMADLAFTVDCDKIKVVKNRFGMDGDEILYNTKQIV